MADSEKYSTGAIFQIKIKGRLRESWSQWFGDAEISYEVHSSGVVNTTLTWEDHDQAALRANLNKILDLNLTLLSVRRMP